MKTAFLVLGMVMLTLCIVMAQTAVAPPRLELEQPLHKPEIIMRLYDESSVNEPQVLCTIYRVLINTTTGQEHLIKLDDVILNKIDPHKQYSYSFIGIYSSHGEFPHGTKVLVTYKEIHSTITMYYH
jgi:hypothetical protein